MFALLSQPAALALSAPLAPRLGVASRAPPVVAAATERYLAGTLKTSSPNVAPAADAIKHNWFKESPLPQKTEWMPSYPKEISEASS